MALKSGISNEREETGCMKREDVVMMYILLVGV